MIRTNTILLLFTLSLMLGAFYFKSYLAQYVYDYAIKQAQQRFGTQALSAEREEKIRLIAQEMKIDQEFIIRKMNRTALLQFGYCNAFVYFYNFLNFLPLCSTPFLFVSEGFFEDLSEGEQRFLIGHELVHIQEHHTQYLNLIVYSFWLFLILFYWFTKKPFISFIQSLITFRNSRQFALLTFCCLVYVGCLFPVLGSFAYKRYIEWVADSRALATLKVYDGALKIIDRWQKEFNMPLHNAYYGLFSDHPSCHERRTYCLHLKNNERNL